MVKRIIFLGASGAVGTQALNNLLVEPSIKKVTLLGRTKIKDLDDKKVEQHNINIFEPNSYSTFVAGHDIAICTLGVGEPSKLSKEDFVKIDKTAVVEFAKICKQNDVKSFHLLSSVGIDNNSSSFFLRTKAELVDALKALQFERLSIYKPSMIITPNNRYGVAQAITLKVWPIISTLFIGKTKKYRGINVTELGSCISRNALKNVKGYEELEWKEFQKFSSNA